MVTLLYRFEDRSVLLPTKASSVFSSHLSLKIDIQLSTLWKDLEPSLHAFTCDVIDHNCNSSVCKIGRDEALELLLPRCIPKEYLDSFVASIDVLHHEVHAYSGLCQKRLHLAWGHSSRT